ncbi:lysophosphatidic acid receptor 6-like [Osmerus mordax]|uniref:lysophosphatidic acid receptor 6-like n=1 Tax=Osmerus mordax TaxID=8014 RepID=UPI00350F00CA
MWAEKLPCWVLRLLWSRTREDLAGDQRGAGAGLYMRSTSTPLQLLTPVREITSSDVDGVTGSGVQDPELDMELRNQTEGLPGQLLPPLANCTIDTSYRFTFYQVSYSVIFLLGLSTNCLALRRLWLSPRTLTSTAVYMANLSTADLFFVVSLPLRIYYYHHKARDLASGAGPNAVLSPWTPGGVFCQLTFTLKYISLYGGIFFLVCIAADRYFAVVHPLVSAPRRVCAARLVSAGIWCLVLGLSVTLPLLRSAAARRQQPCMLDPTTQRQLSFILAALGLVQAAFLLPALLLLFGYCSVLRVLRQPRRRAQRRGRRRTLTVIYWVLGVFLLCFAPYHLNLLGYTLTHVGLLPSCGLARITKAVHPVALALASSNCCLNPLIYYFSSRLMHREPLSNTGTSSQ